MKDLITMFSMPPLGIFEYEEDLENIKDYALTQEYRGSPNLQSVDTYVLNNPELNRIKDFCLTSTHQYQEEVIGNKNLLEIQQSWLNVYYANVGMNSHYHSNSFLSGVFYITSGSPISFTSDLTKTNYSIEALPSSPNKFLPSVIPSFTFHPKPGSLLIFSSNTNHFVLPHNFNKERISLAFNTYPKLPYGDNQRLTVVDHKHDAPQKKQHKENSSTKIYSP